MHYGPKVVPDSLVFCFDAGSDKCTDADDDVTSMRDIAPVAHSSRVDRGITCAGANGVGNITFPTNQGASKSIDLSISARRIEDDADDYANRIGLDDDIVFADEDAWSWEFWFKVRDGGSAGFQSLGGRGATNNWIIWRFGGSGTGYPQFRDNDSTYRRSAGNETRAGFDDTWHQVVFTMTTGRVLNFYCDGTVMGGSVTIADSYCKTNRLMAGYSSGGNKYGLEGNMLCARAYAKTLSAAEVLQNFNATRGRVGI